MTITGSLALLAGQHGQKFYPTTRMNPGGAARTSHRRPATPEPGTAATPIPAESVAPGRSGPGGYPRTAWSVGRHGRRHCSGPAKEVA